MSKSVTRCGKIECNNEYEEDHVFAYTKVWWYLYTINGIKICEISNLCGNEEIIDLSDRNIYYLYPGTKIILKMLPISLTTKESDVYIEYCPDSNRIAYFTCTNEGDLKYEGTW